MIHQAPNRPILFNLFASLFLTFENNDNIHQKILGIKFQFHTATFADPSISV